MLRIKEEERLIAYTKPLDDGSEICSVGIGIHVVGKVCKMTDADRQAWFGRVLSPPNVAKIGELVGTETTDPALFRGCLRAKLEACLLDHSFGDITLGVGGSRARNQTKTSPCTAHAESPPPPPLPPKKRKRGEAPNKALNKEAKKGRITLPTVPPPVWVGARVRIYWPSADAWFEGGVLRVALQDGDWIFRVHYDDHHEEWRSAASDRWKLAIPSSCGSEPTRSVSPLPHPSPPSERPSPAADGLQSFCMENGSQCPKFPTSARFCPSCGSKQF